MSKCFHLVFGYTFNQIFIHFSFERNKLVEQYLSFIGQVEQVGSAILFAGPAFDPAFLFQQINNAGSCGLVLINASGDFLLVHAFASADIEQNGKLLCRNIIGFESYG